MAPAGEESPAKLVREMSVSAAMRSSAALQKPTAICHGLCCLGAYGACGCIAKAAMALSSEQRGTCLPHQAGRIVL